MAKKDIYMSEIINKETIVRFYILMKKADFSELTPERIKQLDTAINYWSYFFTTKSAIAI